jgi:hypothetical protein
MNIYIKCIDGETINLQRFMSSYAFVYSVKERLEVPKGSYKGVGADKINYF